MKVSRFEKSRATIPTDVLREIPREDPRGFWTRLRNSIRAKAAIEKSGVATFEATGGATFLSERRVDPEEAWREVNRPFVVAAVVMGLIALPAIALAFWLSR